MSSDDGNWHLDKKVPIALILALLIQTGTAFYWGGNVENRIANLEGHGVVTDRLTDRIRSVETAVVKLDTTMVHLNGTITDLKKYLIQERER